MIDISSAIDSLLSTPYAKRVGEEYIYVRCPFCGDSVKHLDKPHCSIWVRSDQPLIYHCWICESSGIVNNQFLQDLNISSLPVLNTIAMYNRSFKSGTRTTKFILPGQEKNIQIPEIQDNSLNRIKLDYMRKRLGIKFTYKSLEYLRVIFSIKDFMDLNGLRPTSKAIYYLENEYVGFLTMNKNLIIFRSIKEDPKIRYMKYSVFNNLPLGEQCYTIPMRANVLAPEVDMHIAEGPFDILGIFFNVMDRKTENQIYVSIGGSGYRQVIRSFLKRGFITNLNIHIYSDLDKSRWFYNKIFEMKQWFNSIHLYYNRMNGEKDFGVPRERIQLKEVVI